MPSEIIRLVRVTTPAPVTTPRIPSNGLLESVAGTAPAIPRASCPGLGCGRAIEEADILRSDQRLVRTVAITESPGRKLFAKLESSRAIFTGILWTTLVKFPVALSGGS